MWAKIFNSEFNSLVLCLSSCGHLATWETTVGPHGVHTQ